MAADPGPAGPEGRRTGERADVLENEGGGKIGRRQAVVGKRLADLLADFAQENILAGDQAREEDAQDEHEHGDPPDLLDEDPDRGWGVDEWARRAGQGAVLDWMVATAILPEEDVLDETEALSEDDDPAVLTRFNESSVDKIDRQTVG